MTVLAGLGDHVLTSSLAAALERLEATLTAVHPTEARAIATARATLARSNGELNSRASRVPTA